MYSIYLYINVIAKANNTETLPVRIFIIYLRHFSLSCKAQERGNLNKNCYTKGRFTNSFYLLF